MVMLRRRNRQLSWLVVVLGALSASWSFELDGYKAWDADEVDDLTDDPLTMQTEKNPSQCFSGNSLYRSTKVFCDRQCINSENQRFEICC
jgi:hypothetical protein